ncbi:hypothetical protein AA103196_2602 [Ameyamaea chiangmaiensis NBRC 103196]|nr:hypothetical protein AA103196_2602 [Ameyamaea chiangmaiensis NBRC 103196]
MRFHGILRFRFPDKTARRTIRAIDGTFRSRPGEPGGEISEPLVRADAFRPSTCSRSNGDRREDGRCGVGTGMERIGAAFEEPSRAGVSSAPKYDVNNNATKSHYRDDQSGMRFPEVSPVERSTEPAEQTNTAALTMYS